MKKTSCKRLTAADIMRRDLVVVSPADTLKEAMALMTDNHVWGLPVVDAKSRCVGLISASDILTYEQDHSEFVSEVNEEMAQHFNADTQRRESVRVSSFALEEFGDVRVDEVMARELVSVERETPVVDVARTMLEASVHRALVLDQTQRLYGIIAAIDFVKLFAEQVD